MRPIDEALRILSHFWLEEIRPTDLPTIMGLPPLAETLTQTDTPALTNLAVEYQRLFGFNLPPYESVFIDPSVMLLAPATARVQALYHQASWTPPATVRIGAPDHLGLELLALAELRAQAEAHEGMARLAQQLHTHHLALWAPAFILTLHRLKPHPFYAILGHLTLDLLLATLSAQAQITGDPFPTLPPPPVSSDDTNRKLDINAAFPEDKPSSSLPEVIKLLLSPRECGLFLTREDIAQISRALDLPAVVGERAYMLKTLVQLAGQYEVAAALLGQLRRLLAEANAYYRGWAAAYPAWTPYAEAWCGRLAATEGVLISNLTP